jgi:uracil-DNA glycosylase family protein
MASRKKTHPLAPTESFLPARRSLTSLRRAAAGCRGCPLFLQATQTVFGEGAKDAQVMLVGEQPGDQEDRAGHPFIGPAGKLLDRALAEAGLERKSVYVTNAVKHFNFEPRGKFRLHKRPPMMAIRACRPWLDAELEVLAPAVMVLLGATAAQAVMGSDFRVTQSRGKVLAHPRADLKNAPKVIATLHPSAILRAPDEGAREQGYRFLVADLVLAGRQVK